MTEIVATNNQTDLIQFDEEKVDLIKRTVARGATNDELALFLHQCKRTGLDPLARQIYFMKFKGTMTIITGIDGYRLIADRTGRYAGNDDAVYEEGDGRYPEKASVTVWKVVGDKRVPFTASAYWDEYYPGDGKRGAMWRKMPHVMLAKVAESLALRKAFPADLSGMYTREEMDQAEWDETIEPHRQPRQFKGRTASDGTHVEEEQTAPTGADHGTDGKKGSNAGNPPLNLAEFAKQYAADHPDEVENNYQVVGRLKKLFGDDVAQKFGTRPISEYKQALADYESDEEE